jgi:branched-chain amino acid transport system permease protein
MAVAAPARRAVEQEEKIARAPWRVAVKAGLIGGGAAVYVCVVGLMQRFAERDVITGVISLGITMLAVAALGAGFMAARPPRLRTGLRSLQQLPTGTAVVNGAIAGAITGGLLGVFLLIASAVELRSVLVSVTPALLETISFTASSGTSALLLVALGAGLGVLAAAVATLPTEFRRPLLVGFAAVLIFSLFSRLFDQLIVGIGEYIRLVFLDDTEWLYEADSLTVLGAVLVFVVAAGSSLLKTARRGEVARRLDSLPDQSRLAVKIGGFILLALFLFVLPQIAGRFVSDVLGTVGIYILLGLGLNIVVGYAGLLDLGYVAFFAIGAYLTAMFTSPSAFTGGDLNFWAAVPIVAVIATICGVAIGAPVLRLRGDYLAIVTLGFGEIVRILVQSEWLRTYTGGAQGITQVPKPEAGGLAFDQPQSLLYLIVICCALAAFVAYRLQESRIGRSWVAMREDEQVAEAMGISIIKTKLLAFAMGAAVGSFGGMFFAVKIGSVFPNSMSIVVSIVVLALIVLGGMGSIPGVIIGAFVLVGLPEMLREFVEYRLLIYGAILVAIMILRPEGLIPSARRRLELHEEEEELAQYEARHAEDVEAAAPVLVGGRPGGAGSAGPRSGGDVT